jgi:hypothetical protein
MCLPGFKKRQEVLATAARSCGLHISCADVSLRRNFVFETPVAIVTFSELCEGLAHLLEVTKEAAMNDLLVERPIEAFDDTIGLGSATKAELLSIPRTRSVSSGRQGNRGLAHRPALGHTRAGFLGRTEAL